MLQHKMCVCVCVLYIFVLNALVVDDWSFDVQNNLLFITAISVLINKFNHKPHSYACNLFIVLIVEFNIYPEWWLTEVVTELSWVFNQLQSKLIFFHERGM